VRFRFVSRLASTITAHPGRFLILLLLVGVAAAGVVSKLKFESSYLALLPENAPEVKTIERVRKFTGGTNELVIAVGGPKDKRLPFARRVVDRLNTSGLVQWAHVEYPVEFINNRALYLLSTEKLEKIEKTLRSEVDSAKAMANPLMVDLEEDEDKAERLAELRRLEQEYRGHELDRTKTTSDGRYLLVFAKPKATVSQLDETRSVFAGIRTQVDQAQLAGHRLPIRYAGAMASSLKENKMMSRDLTLASGIALILAIGLITFATRRATAILFIGVPLVIGVILTLAVATIIVGHLNLVSGFLVAALVGLGIDFGIHLYLRFLDERARIHDPRRAMSRAIVGTFWSCFTAAATTSVAFLALIVADFRGFSEYGLIASIGVMLTLVVTFLTLPPLVLTVGRLFPGSGSRRQRDLRRLRNTRQLARPLAWLMVAAGLAFIALSAAKLHDVRFKNNFRQLQGQSEELAFEDYISREVGGTLAPALIMVDGFKQAQQAQQIIEQRGAGIRRVVSAASLVPTEVKKKSKLLAAIHKHADTMLKGDLEAKDAKSLREIRRLASARPWTINDLPGAFTRRLVAKDQNKYFLLLWSSKRLADDVAIQGWAKELDTVMAALSSAGINGAVLDENLIAARVLDLIRSDGPKVLVLSAIAVLMLLLLDFRRLDRVLLVGGSVGLGIIAMLGVMALFDLHLNLFNAVVLPTILGIGIDNAVHLQHAYIRRGRGSIPQVVATSGRAALLSSATTAIGFGAAIIAHHNGIQQMAILALVGVGCTFAASTILFPAVLRILEGRTSAKQPRTDDEPAGLIDTSPPAPSSVVTK
jgi:predicted RND superfamily exporter protein